MSEVGNKVRIRVTPGQNIEIEWDPDDDANTSECCSISEVNFLKAIKEGGMNLEMEKVWCKLKDVKDPQRCELLETAIAKEL